MPDKHSFTFGGVNSDDYGVYVLDVHEERYAVRSYDRVPIGGRNGDLIQDNRRFENVTLVVQCAATENVEARLNALYGAVMALSGYQRLTHTFDPECYRMAAIKGGIKPNMTRVGDIAQFDLEFDCQPQMFLKAGEQVKEFTPDTVVDSGFYTYDDFGSYMQNRLKHYLPQVGYSSDDIEAMEYIISEPVTPPASIKIITESALPFFALAVDRDPMTVDNIAGIRIWTNKAFYEPSGSANQWYYIFQRNSPLTVKKGSTVVYEYDIFDDYQITNPTPFAASPLLRMTLKSGAFDDYLISINGCNVRLNRSLSTDMGSVNAITIDCADMNAYSLPADNTEGRVINCNPFVTYTNYDIELHRGVNDVLVSSNATKLELTPRWWKL